MKKILFACIFTILSGISFGQNSDMYISCQNINGPIGLGDTAIVKVAVRNLGTPALRTNSLYVNITAPSNGRILGVVPDSTTAHFTVHFLGSQASANPIMLTNTGGSLDPAPFSDDAYIYLYLKGVAVEGPKTFNAYVAFNPLNGPDSLASYAAQGNARTDNDNQTTSLTVTQPLPLNFLSINAQWKSVDALVSWKVAREENNNYFMIERSFDGKSFTEAGRVESRGNYTGERSYSYTDYGVKAKTTDKVYYRVRQVDLDGKSTTTEVKSLATDKLAVNKAYLFPNPARNAVKFVYENNTLQSNTELKVRLMDLHGRLILEQDMQVTQGINEITLNVSGIVAGSYYLNYGDSTNSIKGSLRIVKE